MKTLIFILLSTLSLFVSAQETNKRIYFEWESIDNADIIRYSISVVKVGEPNSVLTVEADYPATTLEADFSQVIAEHGNGPYKAYIQACIAAGCGSYKESQEFGASGTVAPDFRRITVIYEFIN